MFDRAAVVWRLWRRRLILETRVELPVAAHLFLSLKLPVSSLDSDSNCLPLTDWTSAGATQHDDNEVSSVLSLLNGLAQSVRVFMRTCTSCSLR